MAGLLVQNSGEEPFYHLPYGGTPPYPANCPNINSSMLGLVFEARRLVCHST